MDILGRFRTADSLFRLFTGDMKRVVSYPFRPTGRPASGQSTPLPMALPESTGVPCGVVETFLQRLDEDRELRPHSVVILRHGQRICQANWQPYSGQTAQMQFSLSKSVVGMAVGIAQQEGLLSLDEKMRDIFPDKLPPFYMGKPGEVTVRQLLTMTSGVRFNEMSSVSEKDWVRGWLSSDCEFSPGSRFSYNSMNSYMLSAAVCKRAGMSLTDYLTPRLWEPLGIAVPRWETCPMGTEKGGWGLYLTPGDMAKLGQLYLQKGRWTQGGVTRQLLPEDWASAACSPQVSCHMGNREAWYGYQLWGLAWGRGCQFNGVFGQYVVILPEQDMVIAVTSGNGQLFEDRTLLHIRECFCKPGGLSHHPLPSNPAGIRSLRALLEHLHVVAELKAELPPEEKNSFFWRRPVRPAASPPPQEAARYNGYSYTFPKNSASLLPLIISSVQGNFSAGISSLRFQFSSEKARFFLQEGDNLHTLEAGYQGAMLPGKIHIQGEEYPCFSGVRVTRDEDGRTVIKLFIVFSETPCVRILKIIFLEEDGQKILLRMDESPSAAQAAGMLAALVTGGRKPEEFLPPGMQKPVLGRLKELLQPKLPGVLKPREKPEPSGNTP